MCRLKQSFGYWFCWICPFHKLWWIIPFPLYETLCRVCLADVIIHKGIDDLKIEPQSIVEKYAGSLDKYLPSDIPIEEIIKRVKKG